MRGFRANSQRLKFGKYWVLCDPLYCTAFALNVLNVVQISIEHEGKLAGGQKTGENGQPRVKAKLLSAELSHVSQSFFLTHSLKLPCKPLRFGVIHPHFSLPLGAQQILVRFGHFSSLDHARVVPDHVWHDVNRCPIAFGVEKG